MPGTKWVTNDVITFARMNQKTLIVQAAEPDPMYEGMLWFDIDDDKLKERNAANNAWIERPGVTLAATISGLWTFSRGANPPFACAAGSTQVANLIADDHAPSHKDGGTDELDVSELAGAIGGAGEIPETDGAAVTWVDPDGRYDPKAHAPSHKDGGADELDVSELAGAIGGAGEVPETDGAAVTWVDPDGRYDPKAHILGTGGPHTGALPLVDLEVGVRGEIIHRGAADWEALGVGVDGQMLLSGGAGANVAWENHDKALHDALNIDADTVDGVDEAAFLLVAATRNRLIPNPSGDHAASGDTISATAGENVAIGDLCYLKNDGKFWLADADAEATSKGMLALATAAIAAEATGVFLTYGKYRDDTWNWTVAQELYIHTTGGNPTGTRPAGSGDIVRIIGHGYTVDILFFNPDQTYLELA